MQVLYYLSGVVNCTPGLMYSWCVHPRPPPFPAYSTLTHEIPPDLRPSPYRCSEILRSSSEKRALVMGTFNSVAFSFNAWLPLLLFKQTEQPRVLKGTIAAAVAQVVLFVCFLAIMWLSDRDDKRVAREQKQAVQGQEEPVLDEKR
jgi:hypothetical protein